MEKALRIIFGVPLIPLCAHECTMSAASGVCECAQKESSVLRWAQLGPCTCTELLCSSHISGYYFPGVTGCPVLVSYCHCEVSFCSALSGRFSFLSFVLSSVRTWLWSLFAVEDRIIQLNYPLGWEVQFRNNICAAAGACTALPGCEFPVITTYMSSAAFLLSNLRVEILHPPCNKDLI